MKIRVEAGVVIIAFLIAGILSFWDQVVLGNGHPVGKEKVRVIETK